MDNFIISAKTKKKLEEKYNLCFKQIKYDFDAKEIPILEVKVRQEEVQIENNKVKAVKK